jgi:hypothetical protein
VIQFAETKRSICFHELNHKLLAAPLRVCFYPQETCGFTVQFWSPETCKVFKEYGQDGVDIRPAKVHDSATNACAKTFTQTLTSKR